EWERTLLERATAVVEQALQAPQQHGLDHEAGRGFWEDRAPGGADQLLVAAAGVQGAVVWPVAPVSFGVRSGGESQRGGVARVGGERGGDGGRGGGRAGGVPRSHGARGGRAGDHVAA